MVFIQWNPIYLCPCWITLYSVATTDLHCRPLKGLNHGHFYKTLATHFPQPATWTEGDNHPTSTPWGMLSPSPTQTSCPIIWQLVTKSVSCHKAFHWKVVVAHVWRCSTFMLASFGSQYFWSRMSIHIYINIGLVYLLTKCEWNNDNTTWSMLGVYLLHLGNKTYSPIVDKRRCHHVPSRPHI